MYSSSYHLVVISNADNIWPFVLLSWSNTLVFLVCRTPHSRSYHAETCLFQQRLAAALHASAKWFAPPPFSHAWCIFIYFSYLNASGKFFDARGNLLINHCHDGYHVRDWRSCLFQTLLCRVLQAAVGCCCNNSAGYNCCEGCIGSIIFLLRATVFILFIVLFRTVTKHRCSTREVG